MPDFIDEFFQVSRDRQKVWDPESKITLLYRALEHVGEAGELANVVKKLERERLGLRGSRATLTDLADEIDDNFITLVLLCNGAGFTANDFKTLIRDKFNKTSRQRGLEEWLA